MQAMQQAQGQQSTAAASLLNSGQGAVGTQPKSQGPSLQQLMSAVGQGGGGGGGVPPTGQPAIMPPMGQNPTNPLGMLLDSQTTPPGMRNPTGQVMPSPSSQPPSPQTLGFNQPIPMQMPDPDPQGQKQAQAPDVALGMAMGDMGLG